MTSTTKTLSALLFSVFFVACSGAPESAIDSTPADKTSAPVTNTPAPAPVAVTPSMPVTQPAPVGTTGGSGGSMGMGGSGAEPVTSTPVPAPVVEEKAELLLAGDKGIEVDAATTKILTDTLAAACAGKKDGATCGFAGWQYISHGGSMDEIYVRGGGLCNAGVCCPGCTTGKVQKSCHVTVTGYLKGGDVPVNPSTGRHIATYELQASRSETACGAAGFACSACGEGGVCSGQSNRVMCSK